MDQQAVLAQKLASASRHQANQNYQEAAKLYRQVLTIDPGNVVANFAIGSRLLELKRDGRARGFLEKVVEQEPEHFQARLGLMEIAFNRGNTEKQSAFLRELVSGTEDNRELKLLADSMWRMAMIAPAIGIYEKCLEINRQQYDVHCSMVALHCELGEFELAIQHVREAIRIDPERVQAYQLLSQLDPIKPGSSEAEALTAIGRRQQDLAGANRIALNYTLGKVLEQNGDFDQAFQHYLQANNEQATLWPYSSQQMSKHFHGIQEVFNKDFFLDSPLVSSDSNRPIFIIGMPGAGTSLVEQILASHPKVFGACELDDFEDFAHRLETLISKPFYEEARDYNPDIFKRFARRYMSKIRALSNDAERVTDKLPQNFLYIGLIRLVFPNAKIVHCKRDPVDTCLSLFTNPGNGARSYSHKLPDLGQYYCDYSSLMRHWHWALPFRIYDIEYEALVHDSETEIRSLLNFCELPFDPECLAFHTNSRAVTSASAIQVRHPIYKDSIGRWKRFAAHLTPLIDILATQGLLDNSELHSAPQSRP